MPQGNASVRTLGVMAEGLGSWWRHCCSGGTLLVGWVVAVGLPWDWGRDVCSVGAACSASEAEEPSTSSDGGVRVRVMGRWPRSYNTLDNVSPHLYGGDGPFPPESAGKGIRGLW